MKNLKSQDQLSEELKQKAKEQGFEPIGIATVPGSNRLKLRKASLQRWLEAGHEADMDWMSSPKRQKIEKLLEGVKSVLAVGLNYYVDKKRNFNSLSIARYAWGSDYHKVIKKRLKIIGKWLESERPGCRWRVCVDSSPLLEKAWAEEAGLGWIGKNSNIINPQNGSWMVLGHLLCTEKLTADKPSKSICGQCQKCITACPTNAINEPYVVDSRKCLAYHTIENREAELPKEITMSMGLWVAGCDICQEVCPWNNHSIPSSNDPDVQPKEWILNLTKEQAIQWSENVWIEKLRGTALKRIKPWMWKRNAKAINSKKAYLKDNHKIK